MSAISIKDLNIAYEVRVLGGRPWYREMFKAEYVQKLVLEKISIQMNLGSVVAVLGKNGSGKTTLIKAMAGLLRPSEGEIEVLGYQSHKHQKDLLRQIAVVFGQKRMLWPELSLAENFELFGAIYKVPKVESKARSQLLAEKFKLTELLNRQVKTFSLGESMRSEVATALLHHPRVLFLDEPTVGMDIESQLAMREAIGEFCRLHLCLVILTSHNTKDIVALANRILLLSNKSITDLPLVEGSALSVELIEEKLLQS